MKFPKHFLVIKNQQFDIGNDIQIEEDLDIPYIKTNFSFPFYESGEWTSKDLKQYDRVQIYFKFFETADERASANISSMSKIFDGYINRLELNENKTAGSNYNIFCRSTIGLAYERAILVPSFEGDLQTVLTNSLNQTSLFDFIPNIFVNGISKTIVFKIGGNKYFGDMLDEIREKYAVQIFQTGDGNLYIQTPVYLTSNQTIEAYVFDLQQNVFNIDYGEINQQVDTVIVVGTNVVGIAFDPIGYQLKLGTAPELIDPERNPTKAELNPLYIYRRDLTSNEECQEVARNELIKRARNYQITHDAVYVPVMKVGDLFIIANSEKISSTQKWIMKKRTTILSKNQIMSSISGYSNSITDFPDDILLSPTGILDTDILEVGEKANDILSLHDDD